MNQQEFYDNLTATLIRMGFQPNASQRKVQQVIDEAHRTLTQNFLFKTIKGGVIPYVVVAILPADDLKAQDFVKITSNFDSILVKFEKASRRLFWPLNMLSVGCYGIVLYTFFDHAKADTFIRSIQQGCKFMHVLKKVYGLTWAVDVAAKRTTSDGTAMLVRDITVDKLNDFLRTT